MRPIKFRGKRIDNGEWVEGWFIKSENGELSRILVSRKLNDSFMEYGHHDVDPATVGQFTGLQDKNGVDIFEGDKWHIDIDDGLPTSGSVEWVGDGWAIVHDNDDNGEYSLPLMEVIEDMEITRTIHDTPSGKGE